jgi:phage gpG-like protein
LVEITIETVGTEKFVRGFSRITREIKDFTTIFNFLIEDFKETTKNVFKKEGTPEKFKSLSPRYQLWKRKKYPGKTIMRLRDRLYKSITGKTVDTVYDVKKTKATYGTVVPYAHRHQVGTFGMPQRKFMQITDKVKFRWSRMIHRWLMGLFERYNITSFEGYKKSGAWKV